MNMKYLIGCAIGIMTYSIAYADIGMDTQAQIIVPDQTFAENTIISSEEVTGTDANGEKETAILDQNGRWHAKPSKPAQAPPVSLPQTDNLKPQPQIENQTR